MNTKEIIAFLEEDVKRLKEAMNNESKMKSAEKLKQIENAQRLNAVINAFRFSWVELSSDGIESILNIASEYTRSIESYLTEMTEGENNENVQP